MATARFLVAGKVQGVCFRASTRDVAVEHGLRGYAMNLPDGRVEVLATGEPNAIEHWRGGSAMAANARVDAWRPTRRTGRGRQGFRHR